MVEIVHTIIILRTALHFENLNATTTQQMDVQSTHHSVLRAHMIVLNMAANQPATNNHRIDVLQTIFHVETTMEMSQGATNNQQMVVHMPMVYVAVEISPHAEAETSHAHEAETVEAKQTNQIATTHTIFLHVVDL